MLRSISPKSSYNVLRLLNGILGYSKTCYRAQQFEFLENTVMHLISL